MIFFRAVQLGGSWTWTALIFLIKRKNKKALTIFQFQAQMKQSVNFFPQKYLDYISRRQLAPWPIVRGVRVELSSAELLPNSLAQLSQSAFKIFSFDSAQALLTQQMTSNKNITNASNFFQWPQGFGQFVIFFGSFGGFIYFSKECNLHLMPKVWKRLGHYYLEEDNPWNHQTMNPQRWERRRISNSKDPKWRLELLLSGVSQLELHLADVEFCSKMFHSMALI